MGPKRCLTTQMFENTLEANLKQERTLLEPKQYQAPQSAMTFPDMKADYLKEVGALKQ